MHLHCIVKDFVICDLVKQAGLCHTWSETSDRLFLGCDLVEQAGLCHTWSETSDRLFRDRCAMTCSIYSSRCLLFCFVSYFLLYTSCPIVKPSKRHERQLKSLSSVISHHCTHEECYCSSYPLSPHVRPRLM